MKRWVVALLGVAASLGAAEDGGQTAAWSKLAVDARSAALGRAVGALGDDEGAVQLNPALLATQEHINIGSQYALLPDGSSLSFLGVARPLDLGSEWAWGLSYLQFDQGQLLERRHANTPDPDSLFRESASQVQLGLGGYVYGRSVALGLDLKAYSHALGDANANGGSEDLGLFWRASPWLDLGFGLRDLYSRVLWNTGWLETLPPQLRASAALRPWGERLLLALEADRSTAQETRLHAGMELWAWPQHLAFRTALDDGLWAAGFGARARLFNMAVGLDYAFAGAHSNAQQMQHRLSLHLGLDL